MPGFVFLSRKVKLLGVKIIFLRNVLRNILERKSIPFLKFSRDHLRSRIICGSFWGSFAVSGGSFAVGDHLRYCTVVPFGVFLHYLLNFKPLDDFFSSKTWLQIAGFVAWVCVCVYIHVSQAIICTFYQCQFQKMVGWVAFKFSLSFTWKLKSF